MNKRLFFNMVFMIIGTFLLVAMGVIVVVNFRKDARILQQPLLAAVKDKGETTGSADSDKKQEGYKTFKYTKPLNPKNKNTTGTETTKQAATKKDDGAGKGENSTTPKAETIKVEVVNCTEISDLGEEVASTLKAAGYEVSFRDETPKTPVSTAIIDKSSRNAAEEVQKILKAGTVTKQPDPKSEFDVTVVIGSDFRP